MKALESHPVVEAIQTGKPGYRTAPASGHAPARCAIALVAADIVAFGLAATIAVGATGLVWPLGSLTGGSATANLGELTILFTATALYLAINGRYSERVPFWTETKTIFCAGFWAGLAEVAVAALSHSLHGHLSAVIAVMLFPAIATFGHALAKHILMQSGAWQQRVVLVGNGELAITVEVALASDPGLGYKIVGRVDPEVVISREEDGRLWPVMERYGAHRLLFALDGKPWLQRRFIDGALRQGVPFAVVPEAHAFPAFAWQATRFFSQDVVMLSFRHGASRYVSQMVKAAMDVVATMILLVLLSPIFLAVALLNIRSGGPVFFAHRRVGIGGKPFYCLKFRTMVVDADRVLEEVLMRDPALAAEWEASHKLRHDPRVTSLGCFLRKTSLDELPQLINVLCRQMSLVGPRPIVESEVRFYGDDIAHYYNTRPGVTGLWQVSGRSNTSYKHRVQLDVWYVNNWTVWLDIAVLLKTLPAVLARRGAH